MTAFLEVERPLASHWLPPCLTIRKSAVLFLGVNLQADCRDVWMEPVRVAVLNTRTTSRVIEPDIKARSANLVGETKVGCGNLSFSQM